MSKYTGTQAVIEAEPFTGEVDQAERFHIALNSLKDAPELRTSYVENDLGGQVIQSGDWLVRLPNNQVASFPDHVFKSLFSRAKDETE